MRLNSLNAFRLPFCAESLRFFGFAFRTVTLAAIGSIIFMAIRAMCFLRVDVTTGSRISFRVFGSRYRIQMLRIDASSIPACMVHDVAVRYRSVGEIQGNPMRFTRRPPESDDAVTIAVFVSCPYSAFADLSPFAVEAFYFLLRRVAHVNPLSLDSVNYKANMVRYSS